jgi:hypothetical protein
MLPAGDAWALTPAVRETHFLPYAGTLKHLRIIACLQVFNVTAVHDRHLLKFARGTTDSCCMQLP